MSQVGLITFAGSTMDRAGHLRTPADQARLRADPAARTLVVWRGKPLFAGEDAPVLSWLTMAAEILVEAAAPPVFLGLEGGAPRFATDVSAWEDPGADSDELARFLDQSRNRHPTLTQDESFLDLRAVMVRLAAPDAGAAATARGVLGWHETHRFCARCGGPSVSDLAGWQRSCPACGARHFPRTDPVVIMLVTAGNRVLIGRSPGWPEGMYSLLAGFMEPGETVEDAVRREVAEETGIAVGRVGYVASQPWPFPASLMIGCWAEAQSADITLDPEELEDAIWVTREEVLASLSGTNPALRPARPGAIARALIERWLRGELS